MRFMALAVTVLIGCGNVAGTAHDAGPGDGAADAAFNPCAPDTCLLADDFSGAALNRSIWATATGGGATITQASGLLTSSSPRRSMPSPTSTRSSASPPAPCSRPG